MKIFAFYLPQFHRIPENDMWWGQGFTEWTNVKKAKPLFRGHQQPLEPLNDYYYDLTDKTTVEWQTNIMHKYGIDGFIYYHYYFEGKLLLEKPCENLLKEKNINQRFFFCWANHSWKKSWDGTSHMLVQQTYGSQKSWEEHFQYLLPFFKDKRYEKKDNKPLFMLFMPFFDEKNEMFRYFDKRCRDEGFDGIALIDSIQNDKIAMKQYNSRVFFPPEYVFYREPLFGLTLINRYSICFFIKRVRSFVRKKLNIGHYIYTFNGDNLLKKSMKHKSLFQNSLRGLFFEWDNTARHGYRGYIITPISKYVFNQYIDVNKKQDYLFINAWNEWCEGMVLEPTKKNGFKYLEWIKECREKTK